MPTADPTHIHHHHGRHTIDQHQQHVVGTDVTDEHVTVVHGHLVDDGTVHVDHVEHVPAVQHDNRYPANDEHDDHWDLTDEQDPVPAAPHLLRQDTGDGFSPTPLHEHARRSFGGW